MSDISSTRRRGRNLKILCLTAASVVALGMGAQSAMAQDAPAADAPPEDQVVVRGVRASMAKAVATKRRSTQIVDSVIAEDIGKLPDNNVVEALQRVPGVQVTNRANGEVSGISIRGMPDITTTWNGRLVFTGTSRQLALQDIPANLINRIDVYKTRTAEQIETGIAGQIDVGTYRPFDFRGFQASAAVRGIYHEQRDKMNPNVSFLISNRWDTGAGEVGALVNLSYAKTQYRNQDLNVGASVPFATTTPPAGFTPLQRFFPDDPRTPWPTGLDRGLPYAPGSTLKVNGVDTPYYLSRDAMIATDLLGDRERPALNAAFQWKPNDNAEYTFEYFYEGYRNDIFNSMNFSFVDWWGSLTPSDISGIKLIPGTNIIKSRSVHDIYGFNSSDFTGQKTDTHVFALNGKWRIGDSLTLVGDLSYQKSDFESDFFAVRTDRAGHDIVIDFDAGDGLPSYSFSGPDDVLTNPNLWNIAQFYDNINQDKGDALTLSLDGDWVSDDEILKKVSFGFRYDDRGATHYFWGQDSFLGQPLSSLPSEALFYNENFFDGRANVPSSWVLPDGRWLYAHADDIRQRYRTADGGRTVLSSGINLNEDFDVQEQTTSVYAQVDLEPKVFDRPLMINVGWRYVSVNTDMTFTDRLSHNASSADAYVARLLPSLTLRYDLTDDIRVRYNYGETLRRPDFGALNPNFTLVGDLSGIGRGSGSRGNPDLEPTESKNQDVAIEWYFARDSVVHLTLFQRDIQGLVVTTPNLFTLLGTGQNTNTFLVSQPVNASDGTLKGAELGLTYFPDNLPGLLDGLGVQASVTWLDSTQNIPSYDNNGHKIGEFQSAFFGVSDFSYNATLAYDKGPIGARLSYVWRDDFLAFNEARLFANPIGVWAKPESSLDFQINYDVNDKLSISFDAVNLTDEIGQNYYKFADAGGPETFNHVSTLWSRSFAVGLRWRFN